MVDYRDEANGRGKAVNLSTLVANWSTTKGFQLR
jgi:hypothetical protein